MNDALVGRAPDCVVRTSSRLTSSRHAELAWTGACWRVRDLGSKNGTTVGGQRLDPGSSAPLDVGMRICFGDPEERWCVVDVAPPRPSALCLDTGAVLVLTDGYIHLPDAEEPLVSVYDHPTLGWLVESVAGGVEPVVHGQVIVAGSSYRLDLGGECSTAVAGPGVRSVSTALLRFTVSPDEEHVDLDVVWEDDARRMPPSVHWYLVVTLARARLDDERAATQPPRERGWVHRDDLCRRLRTTVNKLNVDLHRVRAILANACVADGATLFERRAGSGHIRLGTSAVEVVR